MGCIPRSVEAPTSIQRQSDSPIVQPAVAQNLPITALVEIAGKKIQLEVAQTPQQQATGLMGRTTLADDRGMLFLFEPPRPVQFWMKNTLLDLDMIFLRNGVVRAIVPNVPPCKSDPCPVYGPGNRAEGVDQVIEVRGGRVKELGLKVGDRLPVKFLDASQSLNR
ncbi:MAG: DUF192 domain-containing protein [Leptolyngbyaceae cyanobacterium SU_3_3]|nr:DUF192 domain-containing protein [Leptolyngbyaceae cyanobacterium SU_3_3]NJR50920.1 DUF192 domain-containing protein [Leptolyngbyaceae cyanobacterium CSU_1_3]